jgi:glycosyltransferase involved in cell wall biosynthesis
VKIAYVSKGAHETFMLPEIADHLAAGWDVRLFPLSQVDLIHRRHLADRSFNTPLLSAQVLGFAFLELVRQPARVGCLFIRMLRARSPGLIFKNVALFPKALWLARVLRREAIEHVHIHFIAAPATIAAVAAKLADVPYSVTAHRYDIAQNNLLDWKAQGARFVRAIDEPGAEEIAALLSPGVPPPLVLHMGVDVDPVPVTLRTGPLTELRLAVAARLVGKKGHRHLIDGIKYARDAGISIKLDVFGDGPLQDELVQQAAALGISDSINWRGVFPHKALLELMRSGAFDIAVLPSVTAEDGDKEGIPVFLIESMGMGLPVITTPNGGIRELAGDGHGVLVPERDGRAIGEALVALARDGEERARLGRSGREHVLREFEIGTCSARLRSLIVPDARPTP